MQKHRSADKKAGLAQITAVSLALLLLLFLMPLLLIHGEPLVAPPTSPAPSATLPPDTAPSPMPQAGGAVDRGVPVRVKLPDGTVSQTNLADYLWRVVAAEMPASFHAEALKAQTVAARTYAVAKMAATVDNHPDADMCTDITCCQAYITPEAAAANWGEEAQRYTEKIAQAVTETDGMVATYGGVPIQAVFFSSAAGHTLPAAEVWGNAVPYLSGVTSPEGEEVPNYHSTMSLTVDGFQSIFRSQYPQADFSGPESGWFSGVIQNSVGGVEKLVIGGVEVSGMDVRTLFGLRSTQFTLGLIDGLVQFSVTGYGHGVGMSQYGANALAGEGKTYEEIIKWYYTGVEVETLGKK